MYLFFIVPGEILQPSGYFENNTRVFVQWSKPLKPAGPVDYYQLIVAHHFGPTNSQIINSDSSLSPTALASAQIEDSNHFLYQSDCKFRYVLQLVLRTRYADSVVNLI